MRKTRNAAPPPPVNRPARCLLRVGGSHKCSRHTPRGSIRAGKRVLQPGGPDLGEAGSRRRGQEASAGRVFPLAASRQLLVGGLTVGGRSQAPRTSRGKVEGGCGSWVLSSTPRTRAGRAVDTDRYQKGPGRTPGKRDARRDANSPAASRARLDDYSRAYPGCKTLNEDGKKTFVAIFQRHGARGGRRRFGRGGGGGRR
jgi:hypothetical protein